MTELLLVEDDRFLADGLRKLLESHGYSTRICHSGAEANDAVEEMPPSLMILDLGLPDRDGLTVCRELRGKGHQFPIVMLTSRGDSIDKVVGLESGADDYLVKPFEPHELVARIRAHLRRAASFATPSGKQLGKLSLNESSRRVEVEGRLVALTETEFRILAYLAANAGRALSREQIFESVWGYDMEFSSNTLDVLLSRLRKKLGAAGAEGFIETVRGYGYRLDVA